MDNHVESIDSANVVKNVFFFFFFFFFFLHPYYVSLYLPQNRFSSCFSIYNGALRSRGVPELCLSEEILY